MNVETYQVRFGFQSKNIKVELCFAQLSELAEKKHINSEEVAYVHFKELF